MVEKKQKQVIVIDADLHIKDPHDIILSYFNTSNESQFVQGARKSFRNKLIGLFAVMVFLKFFFEEMLSGFIVFIAIMAAAIILAFLFAESIIFCTRIVSQSARNDGVRGIFFQLVFITIIVILLGLFI